MSLATGQAHQRLMLRCSLCLSVPRLQLQRSSRRAAFAPLTTTGHAIAPAAMWAAQRTYFWPYPENFIPEGATTSSFQSSPVPSVRERIVREYALSPLFGRRIPCCVLGFADSAATLVEAKGELRRVVAQALGKSPDEVELGPLEQMKEMMLHRSGTAESPRLGDEAWSRPDAEARRRRRYARLPVQARTLVAVYLPGEENSAGEAEYHRRSDRSVNGERTTTEKGFNSGNSDSLADKSVHGDTAGKQADLMRESEVEEGDTEDDNADVEAAILAHGWFLQEQLHKYMSSLPFADKNPEKSVQAPTEDEAVEASVAALYNDFGVVYCEVPAIDESGFVFDQLHGQDVDADMAARVVDRWTRRVAQQEEKAAVKKPAL